MHRVAAIIPARFDSTRFPGKPLAVLKGKIIIQHVYEQASAANLIDSVIVATDDKRIFDAVKAFGGEAVMTSRDHVSGTDRTAEAANSIKCDYVVNIQGDEPFIRPDMIDDVANLLYNDGVGMSTLAKKIDNIDEVLSSNVVKVVVDDEGFALYFSRSPIPFYRDEWQRLDNISLKEGHTVVLKHIGIYGFKKSILEKFTSMPKSGLENIEKLEQLRALSAGIKIKVKETEFDTFGIDTIEDLRKAEEWQSISL